MRSRFITLLEEYNRRDATNARSLDDEYKYDQLDQLMAEIVDMNPSSASLAAHLEYSNGGKSTRRKFGLEKDVLLAEAVLSHNPYESDVPHVEWKEIVDALNDIPVSLCVFAGSTVRFFLSDLSVSTFRPLEVRSRVSFLMRANFLSRTIQPLSVTLDFTSEIRG